MEGLRQGCTLSPLLFLIFIDGLAQKIKEEAAKMRAGVMGIAVLLFADDIVLIAKDQKELQALLDVVFEYSCKWRFQFNIKKSKTMVFSGKRQDRKSGLFLGLERLEKVQRYCYLGVDFRENSCWKDQKARLALKAQKRRFGH
jgi:hypothetical protein